MSLHVLLTDLIRQQPSTSAQECLQLLEEKGPEDVALEAELPALDLALCTALPLQPWAPRSLGFRSTALVAWLARSAQQRPEWWDSVLLDHMQLYGKLISIAWAPDGPLVSQPMDDNRFVIFLGEVMCQVPSLDLMQRRHWASLSARCLAGVDFWSSRYFYQHLQSLLAACALLPDELARSTFASATATAHPQLLERVFTFQLLWQKAFGDGSDLDMAWASASLALDWCPSPATCLAAFFAERLSHRKASRQLLGARLAECLDRGGDSLMLQCIAVTSPNLCSRPDLALGFCETLAQLLAPQLLDAPEDLQQAQRSATCRVLAPRLCVALGRAVAGLAPAAQVAAAAALELWAAEVGDHPAARRLSQPAQRWFCFSVFFSVATVARETDLQSVAPEFLLALLRVLSCVDIFREDSEEYRAVCLSIVQCGCTSDGFRRWLVEAFCEFHGADRPSRAARMYFWLGIMSMADATEDPAFDDAWPVLLRCLSGDTALATRAALLAALALPVENGPSGATRMRELVEAALQADVLDALQRSMGHIVSAAERGREVPWLLQRLSQATRERLEHKNGAQAEAVFQLLCMASRREPVASLQQDAGLDQLLSSHPSFPEIFLRHLAARFPEKTRDQLARWLLRRFPGAAAAASEPGPAVGDSAPVLAAL
ncbi:unnamed protein product [Effrenium voratum]|nr:unnamed protein product [Effrenium voratum]